MAAPLTSDLQAYLQSSYDQLTASFPFGTLDVHVEQTTDLMNAREEWTRFQSLQAPAGDISFGMMGDDIAEYARDRMDDVSHFPDDSTLQQFAIFRVSANVDGDLYSYDVVLTRFGADGECFIGLYDPLLHDASTSLVEPGVAFPGCRTISAATPDMPLPADQGSDAMADSLAPAPPGGTCTGDYSYSKSHRSDGWQLACSSFWGNSYWYFFTGSSRADVTCAYTEQRQLALGDGLFRRKNDCEVSKASAESFPAVVFSDGHRSSHPWCADSYGGETTGAAKAQVLTENETENSPWARAAHIKIRKEAFVMQNKSSSKTTSMSLDGDCGGQYGPAAHGTAGAHYADTNTETVDKFKVNFAAGEAAAVAICRPKDQWTCDDICKETDTRCTGTTVQVCEIRPATSKCTRWFDKTDCSTTGKVCSGEPAGCVCPQGKTACNGTCVDLQNDASNCGACGRACGNGQSCSAGTCTGGGGDCGSGAGSDSSLTTCHSTTDL